MRALRTKHAFFIGCSLFALLQYAQTVTLENGILSANGSPAFVTTKNQTTISGIKFQGSNGQTADEAAFLTQSPNAIISEVHANGGAGMSSSSSVNFIHAASGGNGGEISISGGQGIQLNLPNSSITYSGNLSTSLTEASSTFATGAAIGSALHINDKFTILDGSFTGGAGGIILASTNLLTAPTFQAYDTISIGGNAGYANGQKNAIAQGGAGLFLDTKGDIHLEHTHITAGHGGHAIGAQNISARGGSGLTLHNSTNLIINGSTFRGGNGGRAKQLFTTKTNTYTVDASGGNGIYGNNITLNNLSGIIATGGNGGIADSTDMTPSQTTRNTLSVAPAFQAKIANGGTGGLLYTDAPSNVSILDSTFKGGKGGTVRGNNLSHALYNGTIPAHGGNSLTLSNISSNHAPHLILHNIQATGGNGGTVAEAGSFSLTPSANGGHGAAVSGFETVTIDAGTYQGGSGGNVKNRSLGGSGLIISASRATILDGTFSGGHSEPPLGASSGLLFYGNTLEIKNGVFRGEDNTTGFGLKAHASESISIQGGTFSSLGIQGDNNIYSRNAANGYTELQLSSDAHIENQTYLFGNIHVHTPEAETFQNTLIANGHTVFDGHLELDQNALFQTLYQGKLSASNLTAHAGATILLRDDATFENLDLKAKAQLSIESRHSFLTATSNAGFLGIQEPHITAKQIGFNEDSSLDFNLYSPLFSIGATQEVATIRAEKMQYISGSGPTSLSQDDLNALTASVDDGYLTSYDFILSTSSNQQFISIQAIGTKLAETKNQPLPPELANALDQYRNGNSIATLTPQTTERFFNLLTNLNQPSTSHQYAPELKKYFKTTSTPMILQIAHAGQQAQLAQVLGHVKSIRATPLGASGPAKNTRNWSGWIKGYGTKATKDASADYTGYDANMAGAVIGIEKTGNNTIIGLTGGSATANIDTDDSGSSNIETYFGSIYASLGTEPFFIDSNLSFGHNTVDTKRGVITPSKAKYNAQNAMAYLGTGKELHLNNQLSLTPELGGQLGYYHQESFTEAGVLNNSFDDYDYWYFQSIFGARVAIALPPVKFISFQPDLRIHWHHNFNANPARITYITDGTGTGSSANIQSPEEDTLIIGTGLSSIIKDRIKIDLHIDQQLAKNWNSTTFSGSFKIQF